MTSSAITDYSRHLLEQALEIWLSGGWAMIAIAVIAFVMFGLAVRLWFRLRDTGHRAVPESVWRRWIDHPDERRGPVGALLDTVLGGGTVHESAAFFEHAATVETARFARDLRVMKVCVSAAPLVGLLGTVTGMLSTFDALASGSGGDKTMALIAEGISEALITTETGLVIALPGLFLQYQLTRGCESYKAFLAHMETVCTQTVFQASRRSRAERPRLSLSTELAAAILQRIRGQGAAARRVEPGGSPSH